MKRDNFGGAPTSRRGSSSSRLIHASNTNTTRPKLLVHKESSGGTLLRSSLKGAEGKEDAARDRVIKELASWNSVKIQGLLDNLDGSKDNENGNASNDVHTIDEMKETMDSLFSSATRYKAASHTQMEQVIKADSILSPEILADLMNDEEAKQIFQQATLLRFPRQIETLFASITTLFSNMQAGKGSFFPEDEERLFAEAQSVLVTCTNVQSVMTNNPSPAGFKSMQTRNENMLSALKLNLENYRNDSLSMKSSTCTEAGMDDITTDSTSNKRTVAATPVGEKAAALSLADSKFILDKTPSLEIVNEVKVFRRSSFSANPKPVGIVNSTRKDSVSKKAKEVTDAVKVPEAGEKRRSLDATTSAPAVTAADSVVLSSSNVDPSASSADQTMISEAQSLKQAGIGPSRKMKKALMLSVGSQTDFAVMKDSLVILSGSAIKGAEEDSRKLKRSIIR